MTGFGKARAKADAGWIVAEISSVNRKQLEISVNLQRDWAELENEVREIIIPSVTRGRVQVSIYLMADTRKHANRINMALAKEYKQAFENLRDGLKLSGAIELRDILNAPGVIAPPDTTAVENILPAIKKATSLALKEWQKMRAAEGLALKKDLSSRLKNMRRLKEIITKKAPKVLDSYNKSLRQKLERSGFPYDPADENFRREILLFADRSDVTEELTRLDSHFAQFDKALTDGSGVGRKLEFLLQEILREVNTTGSKANDADIAHAVVELKMEIEKAREQTQNIE